MVWIDNMEDTDKKSNQRSSSYIFFSVTKGFYYFVFFTYHNRGQTVTDRGVAI